MPALQTPDPILGAADSPARLAVAAYVSAQQTSPPPHETQVSLQWPPPKLPAVRKVSLPLHTLFFDSAYTAALRAISDTFFRTKAADMTFSERPIKRKPFANFVRKLGFKSGDQQEKEKSSSGKKANGIGLKPKKHNTWSKNNPYPESGIRPQQQASQPSFGESGRERYSSSYASLPVSTGHGRDGPSQSNKSGAPTLATNPETIHSDAGHSRAATTTTGAGALSSMDGAGAGSTFSSPNQSDHSLATTLTTIQSTSHTPAAANGVSGHNSLSQPMGSQFTHQYPVSPSHSAMTASAIPRHMHTDSNVPNSYNAATANNMLTDNASILTLASSSKRRRRSMDTDASVRALAPSSVFGSSRESLPLSVLSSAVEPGRHSAMGGPSAERASVYSSSGLAREGIGSPALASERNSYYKQAGDAKSLRSITNLKNDAASITGIYPRSEYDARSINAGDVASLRSVEAKTADGHARNGSIPSSIGGPGPGTSLLRQASNGGTTALTLSRRSSDWRGNEDGEVDDERRQE